MDVSQLKLNPKNPRIVKDDNFKRLVRSITEFPEMMEKRPMVCVTDADGKIYPLGGNMRLKAIQELKMKTIPDNWVSLADEWTQDQRDEFLIKDNISVGEWDWNALQEWDAMKLEEWGVDVGGFATDVDQENPYTRNIQTPIYEAKNEKPIISDLFNDSKFNELIDEIDSSNANDEDKNFLKLCASRHIVFDYEKIADFYANSNKEVQSLMEKSALIIIDFNKAIENGYIQLSEDLREQYCIEYEEK